MRTKKPTERIMLLKPKLVEYFLKVGTIRAVMRRYSVSDWSVIKALAEAGIKSPSLAEAKAVQLGRKHAENDSLRLRGKKRCLKCRKIKLLKHFYKVTKARRDNLNCNCKLCHDQIKHERWAKNPERKTKDLKRVREWRAKNKDYMRNFRMMRDYGITLDQYNAILAAQNGGCAICQRPPRANKSLAIDHDHETEAVRGLCCENCNRSLGLFRDSPALLAAAIAYLASPPAPSVLASTPPPK